MIVESVSVSYTQKFNLGNYESLELNVFMYAKVETGEDHESCTELLLDQARTQVLTEAQKVTEMHDVTCPSVKKYFYGKPVDELPSIVNNMGFKAFDDSLPF